MTAVEEEKAPERRGLAGRLWHRAKVLTPDALLFSKYKLTKREKAVMVVTGLALSQVASPIADAVYYLGTQVSYGFHHPHGAWFTLLSLKDPWDRLPVHVQNLLGQHWLTGQAAPLWWVTARHDARHVLIGLIATLLIGSITIGMSKKPRKRVRPAWIVVSPFTVTIAAIPGAAAGILLFTQGIPFIMRWGVASSNPWVQEWLSKGSWQLTIIGVLAGFFFAKRVFNPVADTVQLTSLEKKINEGQTEKWWWKFVYTPNYVKRFRYLVASGHVCEQHGKTMGTVMAFGTPLLLFLLGVGVWLKYFSGILPH